MGCRRQNLHCRHHRGGPVPSCSISDGYSWRDSHGDSMSRRCRYLSWEERSGHYREYNITRINSDTEKSFTAFEFLIFMVLGNLMVIKSCKSQFFFITKSRVFAATFLGWKFLSRQSHKNRSLVKLIGFHEYLYMRHLIRKHVNIINEPLHDKTNKMTFVPSKDSDQPGQPPSLISLHCPHEDSLGPWLPFEPKA